MAPTRIAIEPLIARHGVQGLADKVGVHARSVGRWRNEGVVPSPLAVEKLKAVSVEPASLGAHAENKDTGTPNRVPTGARHKLKAMLDADAGKVAGPQRVPVQLPPTTP